MAKTLDVAGVATVIADTLFDTVALTYELNDPAECVIRGIYCRVNAEITVQLIDGMIVVEVSTLDDVRNRKGIEFQIIGEDATEQRIRKHMAFNMK